MKAIAMLAVGLLGSMCSAQHDDYFPDIPSSHWVFETLLRLQKENVIDSPLTLFFRGGAPPRRMEIANWAVHASSVMISRLEDAEHDHAKANSSAKERAAFLTKLAKETDDLAKMAFLFEPELKRRFIDAMALRRELLTFPKRIERIANPQGESLPQRITGPDNPLVINSSGAVMQFNTSKRGFDELHVVPIPTHMRPVELEASNDRYALVLRTNDSDDWKVEVRERKTGTLTAIAEGNKQVALLLDDGELFIQTDGRAIFSGDLEGVTLTGVFTGKWEIPEEITKGIELIRVHFVVPFALHSQGGYLPERLTRRTGTSQGLLLDGGQFAVIARALDENARDLSDSNYSLVDMITGHVYANYGSAFEWSNVFVVDRFVFLAPLGRSPGTLRVYELGGKLLMEIKDVIVG